MRSFLITCIFVLLIYTGLTGCKDEKIKTLSEGIPNDEDQVEILPEDIWVDMLGDEYPYVNDNEFGPAFIVANEKSLNELALIMLQYDFDFSIETYIGELKVNIREEPGPALTVIEKRTSHEKSILQNEKLLSYLIPLLGFDYIDTVGMSITDGGKVVHVVFTKINGSSGPVFRHAEYMPEKEITPYMGHVIGGWCYISLGSV